MSEYNDALNALREKHREEEKTLNDNRNKLPKDQYWPLYNAMKARHRYEQDELQRKYKTKPKRNAVTGALIGRVVDLAIHKFQFRVDGFEETRTFNRIGAWPVEICRTTHRDSKSNVLVIYNTGALETASIGISHKAISGHQDRFKGLLESLNPETAPTIISFTLFPNSTEKEFSDLDQEKYGSLVVYDKEKAEFARTVIAGILEKEQPKEWYLAGTSRGGFNSLQELKLLTDAPYARTPHIPMPKGVLLISPMLIGWNPVLEGPPPKPIPWWKILAAVTTQNWLLLMNLDMYAGGVDQLLTDAYITDKAWLEANPFLWPESVYKQFPKMMIQSTPEDKFPFHEPAMMLAEKWGAEFVETKGEHGNMEFESIKRFLGV